jgi:glycosyltransferase involved in cell wall biosynthesis
VSLQHEFGIFGGEAGGDVMSLLRPLTVPIVTTLHTVLATPTTAQHDVLCAIAEASSKLVVMGSKGRELLQSVYRTPSSKIEVIPHGIPQFPFVEPDAAKAKHGLQGRTVILTFGLLAPSKGIDIMIEAMPEVLAQTPDAIYVVLGATHPNLVRQHGETYRERLQARVEALGLRDHVLFLNQFVDQATLLEFISLCDIYVTPYRNEAQLTSGTLAYSYGLGKAIVSTPYWHAKELLADGRGVLVDFDDEGGFGREVAGLLADEPRRQAMRRRAFTTSRCMIWPRIAQRYLALFDEAASQPAVRTTVPRPAPRVIAPRPPAPLPEIRMSHWMTMCDDTGMLQHAIRAAPDRRHGYCIDDNARALLLVCKLRQAGERAPPAAMASRFESFVQHGWNTHTKRFRNFMSFDRRWLEDQGSEDSHGRTLWTLGECFRTADPGSAREWARDLFRDALPIVDTFSSPRAWAFTLLGLDAYLEIETNDWRAEEMRLGLVERLMAALAASETPDWVWFEGGLSYDNARLPEALIRTGMALGVDTYVEAGLRSLRWLAKVQTSASGLFRPVGTESFDQGRQPPRAFDQQPVEAAASISAYLAAAECESPEFWSAEAERAFAWFHGANDLGTPLVDPATGGCLDGLHPDRPNLNQGAESVLSYLLSLADLRRWTRMGSRAAKPSTIRAISA